MIKKSIIAVFLVCAFLLSSCSNKAAPENPPQMHYVTEICISYDGSSGSGTRCYTSAAEMQPILNYLRRLKQLGAPSEDPEAISGDEFRIQLNYSDGTDKLYRQRCGRYLKEGSAPWQLIDAGSGKILKELLLAIENPRRPRSPVPTWPCILY